MLGAWNTIIVYKNYIHSNHTLSNFACSSPISCVWNQLDFEMLFKRAETIVFWKACPIYSEHGCCSNLQDSLFDMTIAYVDIDMGKYQELFVSPILSNLIFVKQKNVSVRYQNLVYATQK